MEQFSLLRSKRVPVPTPLENFSFLATDEDDIFVVTPEKKLSQAYHPTTEYLNEGSFIEDHDKLSKTQKVQFNQSVSVFHISPNDTTANTEDSFEESLPDEYSKYNSLGWQGHRKDASDFSRQYERISELARKIDQIDMSVCEIFSRSHQSSSGPAKKSYSQDYLRMSEATKPNNRTQQAAFYDSVKGSLKTSTFHDFPSITDVYFDDEEINWGVEDEDRSSRNLSATHDDNDRDEEVDDEESTNQSARSEATENSFGSIQSAPGGLMKPQRATFSVTSRRPILASKSETFKEFLSFNSTGRPQLQKRTAGFAGSKVTRASLPEVRCASNGETQTMSQPVQNTTLKYSADIERLKRQSFEREKKNLIDPKMESKIQGKALMKLNPKEKEIFRDLVSLEVDEEELLRRAEERMPKVQRRGRKKQTTTTTTERTGVVKAESVAWNTKIQPAPQPADFAPEEEYVTHDAPPPITPHESFGSHRWGTTPYDFESSSVGYYRHPGGWK